MLALGRQSRVTLSVITLPIQYWTHSFAIIIALRVKLVKMHSHDWLRTDGAFFVFMMRQEHEKQAEQMRPNADNTVVAWARYRT